MFCAPGTRDTGHRWRQLQRSRRGDESQAEEQVLSFAACATLSAWRRAQALGITNTAERLEMAQKGLDRMSKEAAAKLALRGALA